MFKFWGDINSPCLIFVPFFTQPQFTLETAKIRDKSCLATKQRKVTPGSLNSHIYFKVSHKLFRRRKGQLAPVCKSIHCV